MSVIAIIPARGGSKRIPLKNIRNFAGQPMISHSIQLAQKSGLFDKIIVSTDDMKIAQIAREYQAEVPFIRPKELADDHTGITEVMAQALQWLSQQGLTYDWVCCICATSPFIQIADLKQGLKMLQQGDWHYVFSATSFGFPIFRGFNQKNDGSVKMLFPEHFKTRSQDLPEMMHDAGQFYWGRSDAWLSEDKLFHHWSTIVDLPCWRVQDIDTEDDWLRAEIIYDLLRTI